MDNYEENLRDIIRYVGGVDFPVITAMNSRSHTRGIYPDSEWFTPEFMAYIKKYYADDLALYQNTF